MKKHRWVLPGGVFLPNLEFQPPDGISLGLDEVKEGRGAQIHHGGVLIGMDADQIVPEALVQDDLHRVVLVVEDAQGGD